LATTIPRGLISAPYEGAVCVPLTLFIFLGAAHGE
jgi:hypothetical protein